MNNNDDLLKNYIESQKRQKEIIEESKKRRLENKYNESQKRQKEIIEESKKNLENKYHADQLNNNNKVIPSSIKKSEGYFQEESKKIENDFDIDLSAIKNNFFSFDDASSKLKEGLDHENYLKRGLNRFQKNDFKRAINDFTRGLRSNPENIDIYLVRAIAKMKIEQFKKAIEDFNLYLQYNSKNINSFLDRGDCYLKLGSKELALKDYDKASSLGSELGKVKKNYLECILQKNKKSINNFSEKIKQGTKDPKVYFSRAMAYKKEEACDYALVINDLNKCIDLDPNYEEAYLELNFAKTVLSDIYNQEDTAADFEKYSLIRLKRINDERQQAYIEQIEQKIQNNPLTKEKLLYIIKALEGIYSDEQIGIASGYFFKRGKDKIFEKDSFLEAKDIANKYSLKEGDLYKRSIFMGETYYYFDGLCIFKDRFCVVDGDHGGTVFIPSRIVNQSKDWDYSNARLKDWDVKTIINDKNHSAFGEDEEDAKEWFEIYSFNEPMKYIQVEQYNYLDENLQVGEWFSTEEQAEFHGLRIEDCDQQSSWCDG